MRNVYRLTAVVAMLATLSGCAILQSGNAFSLVSAERHPPQALQSFDEQIFYAEDIATGFEEWTKSTGWNKTYRVGGSPLTVIPEQQDTAFPATKSGVSCSAWIPFKSGTTPSTITEDYVYRVTDNSKNIATSQQVSALFRHLASDMKRQGWAVYDTSKSGQGQSASQPAWYIAPIKGVEYKPVPKYLPAVSGKPDTDYLSYRIMVADRGNGYVSLYISSPCAPITNDKVDQLKGDIGSTELDLVQSDAKNPDNTLQQ